MARAQKPNGEAHQEAIQSEVWVIWDRMLDARGV